MGDIQDVFGGHEFNCSEVNPAQDFEALPAGWYTALIEEAEVKFAKDSTEAARKVFLALKLSVLEPQQSRGRKVFANITLDHPTKKAVDIGWGELSALGRATLVPTITDSSDILNKVVQIKVAVKNSDGFGVQNEVKGYKAPENAANTGQPAAAPAAPTANAPAATQAAPASLPPWKRK